eukprot:31185-Pelagococcus_subviridis.AAC.12
MPPAVTHEPVPTPRGRHPVRDVPLRRCGAVGDVKRGHDVAVGGDGERPRGRRERGREGRVAAVTVRILRHPRDVSHRPHGRVPRPGLPPRGDVPSRGQRRELAAGGLRDAAPTRAGLARLQPLEHLRAVRRDDRDRRGRGAGDVAVPAERERGHARGAGDVQGHHGRAPGVGTRRAADGPPRAPSRADARVPHEHVPALARGDDDRAPSLPRGDARELPRGRLVVVAVAAARQPAELAAVAQVDARDALRGVRGDEVRLRPRGRRVDDPALGPADHPRGAARAGFEQPDATIRGGGHEHPRRGVGRVDGAAEEVERDHLLLQLDRLNRALVRRNEGGAGGGRRLRGLRDERGRGGDVLGRRRRRHRHRRRRRRRRGLDLDLRARRGRRRRVLGDAVAHVHDDEPVRVHRGASRRRRRRRRRVDAPAARGDGRERQKLAAAALAAAAAAPRRIRRRARDGVHGALRRRPLGRAQHNRRVIERRERRHVALALERRAHEMPRELRGAQSELRLFPLQLPESPRDGVGLRVLLLDRASARQELVLERFRRRRRRDRRGGFRGVLVRRRDASGPARRRRRRRGRRRGGGDAGGLTRGPVTARATTRAHPVRHRLHRGGGHLREFPSRLLLLLHHRALRRLLRRHLSLKLLAHSKLLRRRRLGLLPRLIRRELHLPRLLLQRLSLRRELALLHLELLLQHARLLMHDVGLLRGSVRVLVRHVRDAFHHVRELRRLLLVPRLGVPRPLRGLTVRRLRSFRVERGRSTDAGAGGGRGVRERRSRRGRRGREGRRRRIRGGGRRRRFDRVDVRRGDRGRAHAVLDDRRFLDDDLIDLRRGRGRGLDFDRGRFRCLLLLRGRGGGGGGGGGILRLLLLLLRPRLLHRPERDRRGVQGHRRRRQIPRREAEIVPSRELRHRGRVPLRDSRRRLAFILRVFLDGRVDERLSLGHRHRHRPRRRRRHQRRVVRFLRDFFFVDFVRLVVVVVVVVVTGSHTTALAW